MGNAVLVPRIAPTDGTPFNFGDALSSGTINFGFGVVVAIVIPWLTVIITKRVERLAAERSERMEASLQLIQEASAFREEVTMERPHGSYTFSMAGIASANARLLMLTKRGEQAGAEALDGLMMRAGRENISTDIALVLRGWVRHGRFRVTDRPHQKLARRLRQLFQRRAPQPATTGQQVQE